MSESVGERFATNYVAARERFLAVAEGRGERESLLHPLSGDAGVELALDVFYTGPDSPQRLLVLTSGTHGVELACGSACQASHLAADRFRHLPAGLGVLMLHALNPWGAHHCRRNTENNVDLCRNFVDFSSPLPANAAYDEIHERLRATAPEDVESFLRDGYRQSGEGRLLNALMGGQYRYADGFSFGGFEPEWSNTAVCEVLARYAHTARRVCIVDYHSGVGPFAYGSAVCMQRDKDLAQAREAFGGWVIAPREADNEKPESFYSVTGHSADGYARVLGTPALVSIVLEFGTVPSQAMLRVLLQDHAARFSDCADEGRFQ